MEKAVYNVGHAAMMVNAFATNNLEELRIASLDQLHQPIRGSIKGGEHLFPLINASVSSGAHACFLSGSGKCVSSSMKDVGVCGRAHASQLTYNNFPCLVSWTLHFYHRTKCLGYYQWSLG